jgi:hypothetical protein
MLMALRFGFFCDRFGSFWTDLVAALPSAAAHFERSNRLNRSDGRSRRGVRSSLSAEEMMYQSAFLTRESNDDLTIVVIVALLGSVLSLLAIGERVLDVGYMTNLLM